MITPSFGLTATERVLPRLALDFTTASLDPRITFTRALNTATRVNSSGSIETVNADVARFDYDPVTLACKGLLIEESRANLLTYSADLSNAVWIKNQSSIGVTKITAPDSTTSGQKLIENAATAQHIAYVGSLGLGSAIYTMSAYFKAAERTQAYLRLDTGTTTRQVLFDLSAVTATPSSGATATIQSVGGGWYRCTLSLTGAETLINAVLMLGSGGTASYTGNGTSGIYVWGIQLEAGAFVTSYIPTSGSSLTRNVDVATMTGTNFSDWYNPVEGAFAVYGSYLSQAGTQTWFSVSNNSATERLRFLSVSATVSRLSSITSNVETAAISKTTTSGANKFCGAYKLNDYAFTSNGTAVGTDTAVVVPTVSQINIGSEYTGTNLLNGHIQKLLYYPQRLTNAEVQAFSK